MTRTEKSTQATLSAIPSVSSLLEEKAIQALVTKYSRELVVGILQEEVNCLREQIRHREKAEPADRGQLTARLLDATRDRIGELTRPSLRKVINGTGVVLHTGLGRAPLIPAAQDNLVRIASGYASLELDLKSGSRGQRTVHVEELLCHLSGAEAACVVNNNAAAVFLVLNTLAFGKEVIISRGQLIEIGGSFRMPDVMSKSGVKMREVGTTNRTHLRDFETAISDATGLLCVVHTSNFRVKGFTKEVALSDVVDLGRRSGIPTYQDLGGGVLVDLKRFGLPHEPVVSDSIATGLDLVSFSGDKVLGGPQCGIIVGKKAHLDRIRANPIMRAVRCDKLIYAALEPTLRSYLQEATLVESNQVLKMFLQKESELRRRGKQILAGLKAGSIATLQTTVEASEIQAGSGTLPLEKLPSCAISLKPRSISTAELARRLRQHTPPIVGYIRDDKLFIDLKTVFPEEDAVLVDAFDEIGDNSK